MSTVLFARHAESTWNRRGRIQGWAPSRLTERGHAEAARLASALATREPDRLVCSDLCRAASTADAVASETGLTPTQDRTWREWDAGFLQGLPAETAFERFPRFSVRERGAAALSERPAGGESTGEFADRVEEAWTALERSLAPDETAVVVTHGGVLSVLVALVTDRPVVTAFEEGPHENGSVTEISVADDEARLVSEAVTDHLRVSPD